MSRVRHTEATKRKARRLVGEGLSYAAVGRELGASGTTVKCWCDPAARRRQREHQRVSRQRHPKTRLAYREKNREKMDEYAREYRERNRDRLNANNRRASQQYRDIARRERAARRVQNLPKSPLSEAYSLIRRTAQILGAANSDVPVHARGDVRAALNQIHAAEDAVVKALKAKR